MRFCPPGTGKKEVIAEGVETAGERDALGDAGIHLMQGYFFARPSFQAVTLLESVMFG